MNIHTTGLISKYRDIVNYRGLIKNYVEYIYHTKQHVYT